MVIGELGLEFINDTHCGSLRASSLVCCGLKLRVELDEIMLSSRGMTENAESEGVCIYVDAPKQYSHSTWFGKSIYLLLARLTVPASQLLQRAVES